MANVEIRGAAVNPRVIEIIETVVDRCVVYRVGPGIRKKRRQAACHPPLKLNLQRVVVRRRAIGRQINVALIDKPGIGIRYEIFPQQPAAGFAHVRKGKHLVCPESLIDGDVPLIAVRQLMVGAKNIKDAAGIRGIKA